ncbi:C4-dicarboxylate ABC transporter permease [Helicobacter sp. MIT 14-3879]|nr:C4-dicarboxylate ABC transporter permease [Helicobacter sp. MIT 14-3879]
MQPRIVGSDDDVETLDLKKYDKESAIRQMGGVYAFFVSLMCVGYSIFHLYSTFYPLPEILQRAVHLCVGVGLCFLFYAHSKADTQTQGAKKLLGLWDWILFVCAIGSCVYLFYEYQSIMTSRSGLPNYTDIAFGILTTLLVLESTRRVTGIILPLLALIFLVYPFISHFDIMPERLLTRPYDLGDIFGQLYLKTEGLFSTAIGASVSFIFLFILFGAFLARSGMSQLFNDLALAIAGTSSGGPAKVAVISSGFMGSINGSAIANVVGTGAFTIPLMKKIGYDKNFAGAVEASASVGGQILPPIMGASAFIMAETTGVSYPTIALAALLPAVLYFLGVMFQVHFCAKRNNLQGISRESLPLLKNVLKARGHMFLPMVLLVVLLGQSMPISYVAIWTIVCTVITSWIRKETRMSLYDIFMALEEGAKQSLPVMVSCASVGIIIGVTSLTSLGNVITSSIVSFGHGYLFLSLILTMLASMVLGMGLPSIPAYIITATMAAPALATFDVPIIVSHMFVFYFGIFANITPPVALASFAAAGIAKADPMKTSFHAIKLSLVGFIIPFIFVYSPSLMLLDLESASLTANTFAFPPLEVILSVVFTSLIGVAILSAAIEGYLFTRLKIWERLLLIISALLLLVPDITSDIIGGGCVFVIGILNLREAKKR